MTSSGGSSPTSHSAAPRRRFVLSGPSAAIDPRHDAVRGDLADVALADTVFAPHYAKAMTARLKCDAVLVDKPKGDALEIARIGAGATVLLFDVASEWAWVRAFRDMGYVRADALAIE